MTCGRRWRLRRSRRSKLIPPRGLPILGSSGIEPMVEAGAGRVVVCRVGDERFVLPVAAVREVVASPPVTRLPEAPPLVRGLANVHGTLVTTISGPRLLALEIPESGDWLVV